jgi:hypothetical protein
MRKAEKSFQFSNFAFRFFVLIDRKQKPVGAQIGFGTAGADPTGQGRQLGKTGTGIKTKLPFSN